MSISVKNFRHEFTESILNYLWWKWSQMGVFGAASGSDNYMVDPEPLLPFTLDVARQDARVFDEVLDWMFRNGKWINTKRLTAIIKKDNIENTRVMGAVASVLAARDKSAKWRGIADQYKPESKWKPEELFQFRGQAIGLPHEERDPHFEGYGLLRGPVQTRGMSRDVNMADPVNFVFKARAAFGVGIRADVMVYLIANGQGHPRKIADLLGYNAMRVNDVMADLAQAGIAKVRPEGNTKQYWLDSEKWWSFLMGVEGQPAKWIDWRALTRGLTALWRAVWALKGDEMDEYIFSSEMRQAMRAAQNDLYASGIGFEIEDDRAHLAESYAPVFLRNMKNILGTK